jgi:hypothetical protein
MPLASPEVRSFQRQLAASSRAIDKAAVATVQRAATQLFSRIVQRTPVDTGRARNGWQIEGTESFKLGKIIRILNPVEYVPVLESGSSKQAPKGMVRVSANEWPEIVAVEARLVNAKNLSLRDL